MARKTLDEMLHGEKRFGRLTVVGAGFNGNRTMALCVCDCTKEVAVRPTYLVHARVRSCGCLLRDNITEFAQMGGDKTRTHGGTGTPTYQSWHHMRQRCLNASSDNFPRYGGRGITICAEWVRDFAQFLADMGERPAGKTLDRVNVNGNYEPGNCRWATPKEQQANRRVSRAA